MFQLKESCHHGDLVYLHKVISKNRYSNYSRGIIWKDQTLFMFKCHKKKKRRKSIKLYPRQNRLTAYVLTAIIVLTTTLQISQLQMASVTEDNAKFDPVLSIVDSAVITGTVVLLKDLI
jgi:hypothetical protein